MLSIDLPFFNGKPGFRCAHIRDLLEEPLDDASAFFLRIALALRPCVVVQPHWNFAVDDIDFSQERRDGQCTIVNAHNYRHVPGHVIAVSTLPPRLVPTLPPDWRMCQVPFGIPNMDRLVAILERKNTDRVGSCTQYRGETDTFMEVASYGTLNYSGDVVFPTKILCALAAGVRVVAADCASLGAIFGDKIKGDPTKAAAWARARTGSFDELLKATQQLLNKSARSLQGRSRRSPRKFRTRS
jgi:hypothetical protein